MNYYVYILGNPITGLPFYVGIARITKYCPIGFRPKRHTTEAIAFRDRGVLGKKANRHKLHTILEILRENHQVSIEIAASCLTKGQAIEMERALIGKYGRRDIGTGILTNLTGGGEGGFDISPASRQRAAAILRSRPSPLKGKKLGQYSPERAAKAHDGLVKFLSEHPDHMKDRCKGRVLSEEHKQKLSNHFKGRVSPMKGRTSPMKGKKLAGISPLKGRKHTVEHTEKVRQSQLGRNKGKTYEEIYGLEKAIALKEIRRRTKHQYWKSERKNVSNLSNHSDFFDLNSSPSMTNS